MSDEIRRPRGRVDADTVAQQMLDDAEKTPAPADEPPKDVQDTRTPIDRWKEAIQKAGLTSDQAIEIIDAQIDPGYWTEEYRLWDGRVRVVFRSRTGAHRNMVVRELDSLQNPSPTVIGQTITRINLLNSLQEYHDRKRDYVFEHPRKDTAPEDAEKMLQRRLSFINRELPEAVMDLLYAKLSEFDAKVSAALSEGAIEGF